VIWVIDERPVFCCYDEFTCIILCDRSLKLQKLPNFIATDDQNKGTDEKFV
jgi:hypothetical protein